MDVLKKGFLFSWKHAALLLLVLYAALFPFYKYILDVDAVGYITVARHYAAGDWHNAVNGYWSPLNSWLLAPFIKMGLNDVRCFKIANLFFGFGVLYQTERLFRYFAFTPKIKTGILFTVALMMVYYASIQIAADMLFVWIFLMYVNVVLKGDLDTSIRTNMQAGLIAAIAFFAKTYGGVFFMIHFSFLHLAWYPFFNKKGWHIKQWLAGLIAFLPLVLVWI